MKKNNLAILIPALNEENTIENVVINALKIGKPIVIDDGSTDSTSELAYKSGAYVLVNKFNNGYESALSYGMQESIKLGFDFVLTMDADGQHSIESAELLIKNMKKDFDIIIGVRNNKQRIIESFAGLIGKLLWNIDDPFSGLKLYRLSTCSKIGKFDTLNLIGSEMMMRGILLGLKIVTVDIEVLPRADKSRFGNLLKINIKLLRAIIILILIYYGHIAI